MKRVVDTEAKVVRQAPSLAQESNSHCPSNHIPLPNEEKDYKDFEVKKLNLSTENSKSEKRDQSS